MQTTDLNVDSIVRCPHCATQISVTDKFCGNCGKGSHFLEEAPSADAFEMIAPTLLYYFLTLILLVAYKFSSTFPEGFDGLLIVTIIDTMIVVGFWLHARRDVNPLLSSKGLKLKVFPLVISGAVLAAFIVSAIASLINISLLEDVYYSPYLFEDTNSPLLWTVVFTCVFPAVFEEIAFRGYLLSNIKSVTSIQGAVYVSSFVFGIIHLSYVSMLWLVPGGIVFAWLRVRYNTLWYGMIGHFVYNLFVSLIEFRILPGFFSE